MSLISVILPTYNRKRTLARAIDSVLAQSWSELELIVIDDGSTDGTAQWLTAQYPSVQLLRQDNAGVSAARNRGIEAARGDWIALIDSDDRWLPQKLATQMTHLASSPAHRLVHCDEIWIRNGRRVNPMNKHRKSGGLIFEHCLPLCVISPSAALIARSLLDEVGVFDEHLPACEDYDLWLRICAQEPVLYIDTPLLEKYGGHADQLSRQYPAMDRFRLQSLDKLLRTNGLSVSQRHAAHAEFRRKFSIYTGGAERRGRSDEVATLTQRYARWLAD